MEKHLPNLHAGRLSVLPMSSPRNTENDGTSVLLVDCVCFSLDMNQALLSGIRFYDIRDISSAILNYIYITIFGVSRFYCP